MLLRWLLRPPIGVGLAIIVLLFLAGLNNNGAVRTVGSPSHQVAAAEICDAACIAARGEFRAEADLAAQRQMAFWAQWMFFVSLAATLLLATTLYETRRAGRSAAEILRETRRQADAAEMALAETRKNARTQLRAYVGIEEKSLLSSNLTNGNYQPHVPVAGIRSPDLLRLGLRNFGVTPANAVGIWVNWHTASFGERLPTGFDFPDYGTEVQTMSVRPIFLRTSIFPQQVHVADISINNLKAFIDAHAARSWLYVYGHIDYLDIFGTPGSTKFCFRWVPEVSLSTFEPYEEHNEAR